MTGMASVGRQFERTEIHDRLGEPADNGAIRPIARSFEAFSVASLTVSIPRYHPSLL
jgi:hypothetical protein